MKTNKPKHHWLLDAALFGGFLLSFWLELTGVAVHQWLGIALAAVAGYHLLAHWVWVKSVTERFFKQTSRQARLYYVIDATLLIGLTTIIVTGLVISTWFDLALTSYATWKTIHVIASISTLAAVVAKLGLHWRWIIATARRTIFKPAATARQQQPLPVATGLGRREFLRLMGGVSVVAAIAAGSAIDALSQTEATTASAQSGTASQPAGTASTPSPSTSSCTVRCNKGCSYPGHCRRYTDSNNNGRCDLGECA